MSAFMAVLFRVFVFHIKIIYEEAQLWCVSQAPFPIGTPLFSVSVGRNVTCNFGWRPAIRHVHVKIETFWTHSAPLGDSLSPIGQWWPTSRHGQSDPVFRCMMYIHSSPFRRINDIWILLYFAMILNFKLIQKNIHYFLEGRGEEMSLLSVWI